MVLLFGIDTGWLCNKKYTMQYWMRFKKINLYALLYYHLSLWIKKEALANVESFGWGY